MILDIFHLIKYRNNSIGCGIFRVVFRRRFPSRHNRGRYGNQAIQELEEVHVEVHVGIDTRPE